MINCGTMILSTPAEAERGIYDCLMFEHRSHAKTAFMVVQPRSRIHGEQPRLEQNSGASLNLSPPPLDRLIDGENVSG